jgi:ribosome maturation factor RimP
VTNDQIRALVAPLLEAEGFELYDVEDAGATLRVLVDRPGGIDLEAVARATRVVSDAIDEADALEGPTTLEVSSPGLERPLRTPAHFARAIGSRVSVKTLPGVGAERRFDGTLVEVDDEGFTVEGEGGVRAVGFDEVERVRTVFEWGGQPRPGGPKAGKTKAQASRPAGAAPMKEGEARS